MSNNQCQADNKNVGNEQEERSVDDGKSDKETKPSSTPKEENFYYIDDDLKKQLKSEPSNFSLLKTFEAENKCKKSPEKHSTVKEMYEKAQYLEEASGKGLNPKELLYCQPNLGESSDGSRAEWWQRKSLFFSKNDAAFDGAVKFIKEADPDYDKCFDKIRKQLKDIFRYKLQKNNKGVKRQVTKTELKPVVKKRKFNKRN